MMKNKAMKFHFIKNSLSFSLLNFLVATMLHLRLLPIFITSSLPTALIFLIILLTHQSLISASISTLPAICVLFS